jgi:hypothetical protein
VNFFGGWHFVEVVAALHGVETHGRTIAAIDEAMRGAAAALGDGKLVNCRRAEPGGARTPRPRSAWAARKRSRSRGRRRAAAVGSVKGPSPGRTATGEIRR